MDNAQLECGNLRRPKTLLLSLPHVKIKNMHIVQYCVSIEFGKFWERSLREGKGKGIIQSVLVGWGGRKGGECDESGWWWFKEVGYWKEGSCGCMCIH